MFLGSLPKKAKPPCCCSSLAAFCAVVCCHTIALRPSPRVSSQTRKHDPHPADLDAVLASKAAVPTRSYAMPTAAMLREVTRVGFELCKCGPS